VKQQRQLVLPQKTFSAKVETKKNKTYTMRDLLCTNIPVIGIQWIA